MIVFICTSCKQAYSARRIEIIDATIEDHLLLCAVTQARREAKTA